MSFARLRRLRLAARGAFGAYPMSFARLRRLRLAARGAFGAACGDAPVGPIAPEATVGLASALPFAFDFLERPLEHRALERETRLVEHDFERARVGQRSPTRQVVCVEDRDEALAALDRRDVGFARRLAAESARQVAVALVAGPRAQRSAARRNLAEPGGLVGRQ